MDLHEDKEKNLVTATFEFPGVSKENFQIDVHNGRLTVAAETKQSSDFEDNGYAVRERQFGKFSRTLQLPQGIKVCHSSLIRSDEQIAHIGLVGRGNQSLHAQRRFDGHLPENNARAYAQARYYCLKFLVPLIHCFYTQLHSHDLYSLGLFSESL
jgi:hypothetical protein